MGAKDKLPCSRCNIGNAEIGVVCGYTGMQQISKKLFELIVP